MAHMHMMTTYMSRAGVCVAARCIQQTACSSIRSQCAPSSFHLHVDDLHVPSWHTRWPHEPCRAVCVVPALLVLNTIRSGTSIIPSAQLSTTWMQHTPLEHTSSLIHRDHRIPTTIARSTLPPQGFTYSTSGAADDVTVRVTASGLPELACVQPSPDHLAPPDHQPSTHCKQRRDCQC